MEQVIANRQTPGLTAVPLPDPLPEVDGFIAVIDHEQVGKIWYIQAPGQEWEKFLVVDYAGPQIRDDGLTATEWMEANNIILEIDYETAVRWDTVRAGVEVQVIRPGGTP